MIGQPPRIAARRARLLDGSDHREITRRLAFPGWASRSLSLGPLLPWAAGKALAGTAQPEARMLHAGTKIGRRRWAPCSAQALCSKGPGGLPCRLHAMTAGILEATPGAYNQLEPSLWSTSVYIPFVGPTQAGGGNAPLCTSTGRDKGRPRRCPGCCRRASVRNLPRASLQAVSTCASSVEPTPSQLAGRVAGCVEAGIVLG